MRTLSSNRGMAIKPLPSVGDKINDIRARAGALINELILPNESVLAGADRSQSAAAVSGLQADIRAAVKAAGLWAPHLGAEYGGMGLTFLEQVYLHEVLGYSPHAPALFGVVAPNAGNQHLLDRLGTPEQKEKWLAPLARGEMESAFCMTEPDQPGSEPRSIQTTAARDGNDWLITGRKWFTSNGIHADVLIVMCRVLEAGGGSALVQAIVPADLPGVRIEQSISIWGQGPSDHCEVWFDNVRIPDVNLLGGIGAGQVAAQERLGAGRVFHCMYAIGQMWRAFDLMVERASTRVVSGAALGDKQFVQGFIADSYIDLSSARMLTIHAAHQVDTGAASARADISAIKVAVPAAWSRVADRAIQVWGAAGITDDLPLGTMYLGARMLRIADGPDEVHRALIGRTILRSHQGGEGWALGC